MPGRLHADWLVFRFGLFRMRRTATTSCEDGIIIIGAVKYHIFKNSAKKKTKTFNVLNTAHVCPKFVFHTPC